MKPTLSFWILTLCLLGLGRAACAQPVDLHLALVQSSRVGVLPFANLTAASSASGEVLELVRSELIRKAAEVADSAATADALRKFRIRNASELTMTDAQSLAANLDVRYLMIGAVERFQQVDSTAEVAVSARLLDAATGSIVWASMASLRQDPSTHFLGLGHSGNASLLAHRVVQRLLKDFRYSRKPRSPVVTDLRLKRSPAENVPCRKIAVVTFGNESATNFAGHIVANQLVAALFNRGFELADPGRIREVMIAGQDLLQGEMTVDLLKRFREDLGADFVLTGTVSRFETNRAEYSEDPIVAFEARLIETATANVVWAKTVSRDGADSDWLLGLGYCHSLAALSHRMVRDLASDIPVKRVRLPHTIGSLSNKEN